MPDTAKEPVLGADIDWPTVSKRFQGRMAISPGLRAADGLRLPMLARRR